MVNYEEKIKVKPTFKKQFQQEREPLQYMNKLERKNKLNPIENPKSRKSSSTTDSSIIPIELSTALKIEIGRFPFSSRPHVTKVAEVLEEILQAVEEGRSSLKSRMRLPVSLNKAEKSKIEDESKANLINHQREEKRKKRDKELKEQLRKIKEEKDRKEAEDAKRLQEEEKIELENKKLEERKKKEAKERKRKQMEELKRQKQEESERTQKEQEVEEKRK